MRRGSQRPAGGARPGRRGVSAASAGGREDATRAAWRRSAKATSGTSREDHRPVRRRTASTCSRSAARRSRSPGHVARCVSPTARRPCSGWTPVAEGRPVARRVGEEVAPEHVRCGGRRRARADGCAHSAPEPAAARTMVSRPLTLRSSRIVRGSIAHSAVLRAGAKHAGQHAPVETPTTSSRVPWTAVFTGLGGRVLRVFRRRATWLWRRRHSLAKASARSVARKRRTLHSPHELLEASPIRRVKEIRHARDCGSGRRARPVARFGNVDELRCHGPERAGQAVGQGGDRRGTDHGRPRPRARAPSTRRSSRAGGGERGGRSRAIEPQDRPLGPVVEVRA